MTYTVYWIALKDSTDPYTQGYVGITRQALEKRLDNHRHNHKNRHLRNRCRQDVVILPLAEDLTRDEARMLERRYRPAANIGWNIAPGGDVPPPRTGQRHPTLLLRGADRTSAQKRQAERHSTFMKGRAAHNAKQIVVNGQSYPSMRAARQALRIGQAKLKEILNGQ